MRRNMVSGNKRKSRQNRNKQPGRSTRSISQWMFEHLEPRDLLAAQLFQNEIQHLFPGANVNASNAPSTFQINTKIAINPTNPLNLEAITQNGPDFQTLSLLRSVDGGKTWTSTTVDGSFDFADPGDKRLFPSVAFDSNGNLFYSYVISNPSEHTEELIVVFNPDDGADNNNTLFDKTVDTTSDASQIIFEDSLATGVDPGTGNQAVYVVYVKTDGSNGTVYAAGSNTFAFQSDFEFTSPVQVSDHTDHRLVYPSAAVGAEGQLYVSWQDSSDTAIRFDSDNDGMFQNGNHFGNDVTVQNLHVNLDLTPIPSQPNLGISNAPEIAVDNSGGPYSGRVYIAYADSPLGLPNIFLTWSDNQGVNWSNVPTNFGNVDSDLFQNNFYMPSVAVDQSSGQVSIVYYKTVSQADQTDINLLMASSNDGGVTFSHKQLTTATSSPPSANTNGFDFGFYTSLAVFDGTAQAMWPDDRAGISPDVEAFTTSVSFDSDLTTNPSGNVLQINGDDNGPTDDTIELQRSAANPNFVVVTVNGSIQYAGLLATLNSIVVNGLGGNDTLIVDSSNGLINVPLGIKFDGGTGFNRLELTETNGDTQTSDTYSVGPNNGEGSDVIVGPSGKQTTYFQNLAPVLDNVPTTTQNVYATPAANAINYTGGPGGGIFGSDKTGLITIDNQESYEFSNKVHVIINALAGSDEINLNNPETPSGLTDITINGDDPTASDTLIVNGTSGNDNVTWNPTTLTAATITGAGPVKIFISTVEHVTYNGQGGDDALTAMMPPQTPSTPNQWYLKPTQSPVPQH